MNSSVPHIKNIAPFHARFISDDVYFKAFDDDSLRQRPDYPIGDHSGFQVERSFFSWLLPFSFQVDCCSGSVFKLF